VTAQDTVVVTGAAGWLGQNLVRALADRGRVRALVGRADEVSLVELAGSNIEAIAGDVRDPATADRFRPRRLSPTGPSRSL